MWFEGQVAKIRSLFPLDVKLKRKRINRKVNLY
jgi:hypothetical protein